MEDGGNDGSGSDSEPSVDNIPTAKLLGKKGMSAVKDTKSLVSALRKAARKRRRMAEAAAAKRAKKRSLEAEEASAAAEITAAANLALSVIQTKDTKPILPGVNTGSYGGGDIRRMHGMTRVRVNLPPRPYGSLLATTAATTHTTANTTHSVSLAATPRREYGLQSQPQQEEQSVKITSFPYDFGIPGILSPGSRLNDDQDQVGLTQ